MHGPACFTAYMPRMISQDSELCPHNNAVQQLQQRFMEASLSRTFFEATQVADKIRRLRATGAEIDESAQQEGAPSISGRLRARSSESANLICNLRRLKKVRDNEASMRPAAAAALLWGRSSES